MRTIHVMMIAALLACAMTTVCVGQEGEEKATVETPEQNVEIPEQNVEIHRAEDEEMQTGEAPKRGVNDFSHPDVKVTAMIPDFLGKEIPAGEDVEMIVWFSNQASSPMNVHGIFAALQSSMDASRFIQNFTPRGVNLIVESNTETSISYKFRPSEYLTAMPYRFFSVIEYSDENSQRYFNILFNETLGFAEANVAFDVELVMTYLIIVGFFVGIVYLAYYCVASKTTSKSKSSKSKKSEEPVPHEENEWLVGTSAHKPKSSKKSKKN